MKSIYLVLPAVVPEVAGQVRVVYALLNGVPENALRHYRAYPSAWTEVGLVSSAGKVVCMSATPDVLQAMAETEPIAAGNIFVSDEVPEAQLQAVARRMLANHGEKAVEFASHHAFGHEAGPQRNYWLKVEELIRAGQLKSAEISN